MEQIEHSNSAFDQVAFIGTYADGEYFDHIFSSKIYDQLAANRVEGYYIKSLAHLLKKKVYVFSSLVVTPSSREIMSKLNSNITITKTAVVSNVPFLNNRFKIVSQTINLSRAVIKWIIEHKEEKILLVVYAMNYPFLISAGIAKMLHSRITVINIVPDLPIYMHRNEKSIIQWMRQQYQSTLMAIQTKMDGFVLYAEAMTDALNLKKKNRPWIVIEGLFDCDQEKYERVEDQTKSQQKQIIYAGCLEAEYGVDILTEGFIKAELEDTKLVLYGNGSYVDRLSAICAANTAVEYGGCLSADEVYNKMCSADLLVNPRPSTGEFTNFSCPSKTFEYMSTGVPVLMTRLGGIPKDFYNYVYPLDDETSDGVAMALKQIFSVSEELRRKQGEAAKKFIFEEKNLDVQVGKLLIFAENIGNN